MSPSESVPEEAWSRLRIQVQDAFSVLLEQLESGDSEQNLLDAYLEAKRQAAEAFQALVRTRVADQRTTWTAIRETLAYEMRRKYGGVLPENVIRIPYQSRTHEELFSMLAERLGQPVPAALLRVITADSVHTERRLRELRELGLDLHASKRSGSDTYVLRSLDIDISFLRSIVINNIKGAKIGAEEREDLLSQV